jgi:hypothetical protein
MARLMDGAYLIGWGFFVSVVSGTDDDDFTPDAVGNNLPELVIRLGLTT